MRVSKAEQQVREHEAQAAEFEALAAEYEGFEMSASGAPVLHEWAASINAQYAHEARVLRAGAQRMRKVAAYLRATDSFVPIHDGGTRPPEPVVDESGAAWAQ